MYQRETNFSTSNMIILRFPPFSGGNFICNCLGLSRHALLKHSEHANYGIDNPDDYSYRLRAVMSTLPNAELGVSELKKWTNYEWNDNHLYSNGDLTNWSQYARPSSSTQIVARMSKSNLDFYILLHPFYVTKKVLQVWPNARVIQLINVEKFWRIASQLKDTSNQHQGIIHNAAGNECREKYQTLAGIDWPLWSDFEASGYNINRFTCYRSEVVDEIKQFYQWHQITNPVYTFDIDSNIFDEAKFLAAMKILYEHLGYTDFDQAPILPFYRAYIRLHLDL